MNDTIQNLIGLLTLLATYTAGQILLYPVTSNIAGVGQYHYWFPFIVATGLSIFLTGLWLLAGRTAEPV